MKLPDKLPKHPMFEGSLCQKMTEEDWLEYFECREKYDNPMTSEEKKEILHQVDSLIIKGDKKSAFILARKIPMKPYLAYCLKSTSGLKTLSAYNLYEAKLEYPDEF